jgi:hypothetical protein
MRTVRQDLSVDDALDDACARWSRTQDAWEMIEWVLARDPTVGEPVTEGGLARSFVFEGSIAHDMPTIQVLYVLEEPYVTIRSAVFRDPARSAGTA